MTKKDKNPEAAQPDPQPTVGVDQHKQGPTSLKGLEASELPDGGRGPVETDYGKESARKTPDHTGGTIGGNVGLRGTPDIADADDHGGRKKQ